MKKIKFYLVIMLFSYLIFIVPNSVSATIEKKAFTSNSAIIVGNYNDLKTTIENATSDINIELKGIDYNFAMNGTSTPLITNSNAIKVTITGAIDGSGTALSSFTMDGGVSLNTRFIKLPNGVLEVSNINFNGVANVAGGIHARDVKAINTNFTNDFGGEAVSGGGAINVSRHMHIEKSVFRNNSTGLAQDGGAVAVEYGGSVFIDDSDFYNNRRIGNNNQYGGAVSIKQPGISGSTIVVSNAIFDGNRIEASGNWTRGGAIHVLGNNNIASLVIDNVLFKNNSSTNNGGALALMNVNNAKIQNSTFINNATNRYGGGLYLENSNGSNEIINSTFIGNTFSSFLGGGSGIGLYSSSIAIDPNTIVNNTISFPGTASSTTIKDSILISSTAHYASARITYLGTNIARKASSEPAVVIGDVLVGSSVNDMVSRSDTNFTFDIKKTGAAYQKINTTRRLPLAQNGVTRKTPLSDVGAHESGLEVTFDSQGGNPTPPVQDVYQGDVIIAPSDPIITNYDFNGWYTASTGGTRWNIASDVVTNSMTLYAQYSPKSNIIVSFEADNGATNPSDIIVTYNSAYGSLPVVNKTGYNFNGWYTASTGGDLISDTSIVVNSSNHTLYAQYSPKSNIIVSFEADNGAANPSDIIVTYNSAYGSLPVVNKTGYNFNGWYTASTGGDLISDTSIVVNSSNHTLYAQYTKDAKVIIAPTKPDVNNPVINNNIVKTGSFLNLNLFFIALGLLVLSLINYKYLNNDKRL